MSPRIICRSCWAPLDGMSICEPHQLKSANNDSFCSACVMGLSKASDEQAERADKVGEDYRRAEKLRGDALIGYEQERARADRAEAALSEIERLLGAWEEFGDDPDTDDIHGVLKRWKDGKP